MSICLQLQNHWDVYAFLKGYNKGSKAQPNYTAAVTHGLSKAVGTKSSKPKLKGPSSSRKAEIESIVVVDNDITVDVTANNIEELLPSSSPVCGMPGTNNSETSQLPNSAQMISSSQVLQLNVNPSTALSTVTIKHSDFKSPTYVVSPSMCWLYTAKTKV